MMNSINFDHRTLQPSKVVCIGRNYAEHAAELGNERPSEPVIFIKPNSAISAEIHTSPDTLIHYEGEISLIVENGAFTGVGFGLDLTKRELQTRLKEKGLPWERAKAFDQSAVFSDFVSFDGDLSNLSLELLINGQQAQQGGYDLMLFKPEEVLSDISRHFTLTDGDILMTGTPKGVGAINIGDEFIGRVLQNSLPLIECRWLVK